MVDKQAVMREIGYLSCEQPGNRHKPNEAHKPRRLTKTEKRLVRRIIKRTTDADRLWAETNAHVAKSLGVNRSTVVRAINRLKKYGILCPVETRVSSFGMVLTPYTSSGRPATPQKTSDGVRPWVR